MAAQNPATPSVASLDPISDLPELPSTVEVSNGGKTVTLKFIDIADTGDMELLRRFYNEMMIPNFPILDELDPLEKWEYLLGDNPRRQTYAPDFHVLIVVQEEGDNLVIMGGAVFEYYAQANSGLLTYLTVGSKFRGFGLGNLLTDRSKEILERNAKKRGHLAGCNAIFLETNSAMKVQENEDVISPAKRHEIFYKMGLRQVDIDYVQAPLWKGKKKVNYLLLCAFLTPRIPREDIGGYVSYYLPSSLLRNSIRAFWSSSSHYTNYRYTDDVDYKRMMDQLRRRNNINLLDLPWERPFTIVDLRESFDLELLVQFYEDILSPHYASRKEELDPLENWLGQFPPYDQNNQEDVLFHIALALKYSEDEEENSKPMIVGGLAFEYYIKNNSGFLAYLIVPTGERGERMATALIDYAVETINFEAKSRGHLSGCNVIFMETSSDSRSSDAPMGEFSDLTQQHPVLERMGWKLLDFDYIQPPLSPERKSSKNLFLMVYATLHFPQMMKEEVQYEFLPRVTLKTFLEGFWAFACSRIGYDYSNDTDYRHMMDDIQRREKIPLLGRPWQRPWTLVDLRDDYDHRLLLLFYKELLQPHIAQDELESVEDWLKMLSPEGASKKDFHVLVALRYDTGDTPTILAGLTFKYLTSTNCGFLTYLIMKWQDSKEAVARALVLRAVDILDQDAIARGHLGGCNVIFLETGNLKKKLGGPVPTIGGELVGVEPADVDTKSIPPNSVLDITQYDALLERLGWRLLDLDYVAPPSFSRRKKLMSLSVFLTPRIPKISHEPFSYYHYLPRPIVKKFMEELWRQICYQTGYDFANDGDYRRMMDIISRREKIPLLELPWERPWTLLDLREDYDVRLLYSFYQNFMIPSFPSKEDRVPLSQWIQFLSSDDNPFFEDFHVLLALDYPNQASSSSKINEPVILGGCSFSYYAGSNCGFISYLLVKSKQQSINSKLMIRSFIEEAVEVLDQNAIERGHIAGCNAIFLQASTQLSHVNSFDQTVDHETLHQSGWHMLPFDYHQAPVSAQSPAGRPLLLLALQTPKIPRTELCHYIPKELLKNFLQIFWGNVFTAIGKRLDKDQEFKKMLSLIDEREKVELAKLPWILQSSKL